MKTKILITSFILFISTSIFSDTLIGRCTFNGQKPRYCTSIGTMTVYHSGDFKIKSISGKFDCYDGTGTIWIVFHSKKSAETFKFIGTGNVQTCSDY